MILYINDEYCSSVEQLKGYFTGDLTTESVVYGDLLDYGRYGEISQWLQEKGEAELSGKVDSIDSGLSDSEYFAELKKVFGVSSEGVASSLKPAFDKCFHLEGMELGCDEDKEKSVHIKLKVLLAVNERYELVVSSSWGIRAQIINPSEHIEGEIIKQEFTFRKRPGKDWDIISVRAGGVELFTDEIKRGFCLQPVWDSNVTAAQKTVLQKLIDDMVKVTGGTFTMGATSEQGGDADSDEKPTHKVTLSDYYICKYEVTQALWKAVMGGNPSYFWGDNLPVEQVSWNDCKRFIEKLNSLTGLRFRLPTEAEWEFAARGGNNSRGYKYAGGNTIGGVAWYDDNSSSRTSPVDTKMANELGLHNMSGNVWEWCADWYGNYSSSPQTNPTGPSSGSYRVLRGGSWSNSAQNCRVSCRYYYGPGNGDYNFGFRLALRPKVARLIQSFLS